MNFKLIARYVGIALLFNSAFMFLSMFVSMLNGFDSSFSPMLISGIITMIVGIFPLIFVHRSEEISLRDGFAITIFAWILSIIFGMLPYVIYGGEFSLINALFESVSGYTTTGGTILQDIEALPKGLLFWRSSTHYIGGIGVVVFMLLVLPSMSTFKLKMSKMEISSLSKDNYRYKTKETLKIIFTIYLGITALTTIFLMIAGMNGFDAINHAFSIVATGGFSTKNASILSYNSFPIELVCMFFMLLSGLHFGLLYSLFINRSGKIFHSPVIRFFLIFVLIASIAVGVNMKFSGLVDDWGTAFRQSFFSVISAVTTTGLATSDNTILPSFSIFILLYCGIQGACSGSTTGGLKVDRIWIFIQTVKTHLRKLLHPNAIIPIRVGNHTIDPTVSSSVSLYVTLYFAISFIITILISASGIDFIDSFSASLSSIGNVGPGFGTCGSLDNFNHFNAFSKFLLSIEMLLGRLEIYPILMIFVLPNRILWR